MFNPSASRHLQLTSTLLFAISKRCLARAQQTNRARIELDRTPRFLVYRTNVLLDEKAALKKLQQAYRGTGLEIRFYPKAITSWRWQIGRNGDGEHFELLAWSGTADGLLDAIRKQARAQARNGQ